MTFYQIADEQRDPRSTLYGFPDAVLVMLSPIFGLCKGSETVQLPGALPMSDLNRSCQDVLRSMSVEHAGLSHPLP